LTPALAEPEIVLVRYGELALKKGNRRQFEDRLAQNIREAARSISAVKVEHRRGRLAVLPERRTEEVALRLQEVFGIKSARNPCSTTSSRRRPIARSPSASRARAVTRPSR
jgi:adenylyl- and sulfurtransferase ThiI